MKQDTSHVVYDTINEIFVCKHCEDTCKIELPIEVCLFTKRINAFIKLHEDCKPKEI